MFQAAKQNRIFQDVVDQIQEAILSGRLKPGDTLPSERDLKEQFQTSRGTLREALRVLEQKGLVEIRVGVGGGAVVKAPPLESIHEGLGLLIRFQKISLRHLAEFREGVEGTVAAMAAQRATGKDLEQLDRYIREAEETVRLGVHHWREFVQVDQKIHQALAKITGNPMYIVVHQMVHDNIQRYYEQFLPWTEAMLQENFEDLRQIVELIRQRRKSEARALAQKHVRRFNGYMMAREQQY
ncbi:MAG: FadR/GntR family transcriptional regulator [Desulfobacterales bacterium]